MRVMRMLVRRSEGIDCWEILLERLYRLVLTGGFQCLEGWIISVQAMCQLDWVYVCLEELILHNLANLSV